MGTNDETRGGTGQGQVRPEVAHTSSEHGSVHPPTFRDLQEKLREDLRPLVEPEEKKEPEKPKVVRKSRAKKKPEPQSVVAETLTAEAGPESDDQGVYPHPSKPRPLDDVLQKCREIEAIFEQALGVPPKVDLRGIIDSLETRARIDLAEV